MRNPFQKALSHRVTTRGAIVAAAFGGIVAGMARGRSRTAHLEAVNAQLEHELAERARDMAARAAAEAEVLAINQRLRNALLEVSEREEVIRRQAERQHLLNEFARMVGSSLDLQSIFALVVHHVIDTARCQWCAVAVHDEASQSFRFVAVGQQPGVHIPPGYAVGDSISEEHSASGMALRSRDAYVIDNIRGSSVPQLHPLDLALEPPESGADGIRRQNSTDTYGSDGASLHHASGISASGGSLAALPIIIDGRVWGALTVAYATTGEVSADRLEFLDGLAAHLAVAIKNSQLYGDLRDALDTLRQTQDQIVQQERLRALGQMASGIAHDLNNALVPIVGFCELLLANPDWLDDRAVVRRYLDLIYTGGQDAAGVVRRLREFYRPREEEAFTPVDLPELVEQVIALTQPKWKGQAQALGRTIQVRRDLQSVSPIAGDDAALREALTNLIFNAVDAMPHGGTLTLRTCEDGHAAILEVIDTGGGMPEEVRRRCLEPFFTTKGERGSGLGLAMVYGIAKRHQGDLEIESEPGQGTTVRLRLPRRTGMLASTRPSSDGAHEPEIKALRILVVDDEPVVRSVTASYLSADGHQITEAANGQEAIEWLRDGSFDVIVTDRAMPDMSGDHLAKVVKECWPDTRVVLLTGFGELMAAAGEWPEGIDAVLGKPVNRDRLRRALAPPDAPQEDAT
ncbi:MAG TPA: ATP-binding protein [Chloroflexota bacterium]|nr:ATP-binding protein [Chloroflexota bacterium]